LDRQPSAERHHGGVDIFDDLAAEHEQLAAVLTMLDSAAWEHPSGASGWTIADVVLHLAQTEEMVVASARAGAPEATRDGGWSGVDATAAAWVERERGSGDAVLARWQQARRDALAALRSADPDVKLAWVDSPLKPATLATTRLAEHWAHALDIAPPLGIDYPDTDRLRHVAWLGHATLPYAFAGAGREPQPVRCSLVSPSGEPVDLGPVDALSTISGALGAFCRVGARRLPASESGLTTTGPYGAVALGLLRNYAA
jgi:uncharacterized protein (TIGR03084 family)